MAKKTQIDLVQFSDLVGLIYEAAYAPEHWPELMRSLENLVLTSSIENSTQGKLLEPHFVRAVKIDQKISALQSRNVLFNQMLNQLPLGVIITDSEAQVLAMNDCAKTLPSLTVIDGLLHTSSHQKTDALRQCILACAHGVLQKNENTFFLEGKDESQRASIWIAPTELPASETMDKTRNKKCVALYVSSPTIHPEYDVDVIRHEFKLTPAEARLVKLMANGCHNLNDAAKKLKVSVHTVRTQIKVIFEKTHTGSQIELVKKVLTNPAVLFGAIGKPNNDPLEKNPTQSDEKNKTHLRITLPDGRYLGYTQHGNGHGNPLIYCHALVHTDKQLLPDETIDNSIHFNIISPRRPGFLGSSWAGPKYSLKTHAHDIIHLADSLGIDTFQVAGYSNGTPYAAALAYYFPDRVTAVKLIATMVPPTMDRLDLLSTTDRIMLRLGQWLPVSALTRLSHITMKSMKKRPNELIERNADKVSEHERILLQTPELFDYLKTWVDESYPDRVAGIAFDLMVRIRPWGFDPANIKIPVELWHARDDSTVSFQCAEKLAQIIPQCKTHWLDRNGHYIFFTHFKEIMAT